MSNKFEAIYIQALYGSIEQERIEGFETSILSLLSNVGNEWWKLTKSAFSSDFIVYADGKIKSGKYKISVHPGASVEQFWVFDCSDNIFSANLFSESKLSRGQV